MSLLTALALACSGGPPEDWWTVPIGYVPPDTGDSGQPVETGPLEDQRALHGSLTQLIDGVDVSLRYLWVEGGETRCDVRYTSDKVRPVTCKKCLMGLSIVHTGGTIAAGSDCAETGWDGYAGEPLYVGLDAYGSAYRCLKGCTDGTGEWFVAGESTPNDSGFDFLLTL